MLARTMRRTLMLTIALVLPFPAYAWGPEQAKNIVLNIFGGVVSRTEVAEGSDGRDYILAVWQETELHNHTLRLLRSFGGTFVELWQHEAAPWVGVVRLLDINEDDYLDVYWTEDSFGNVSGLVSHWVYDGARAIVVEVSFPPAWRAG